MKNIICLLIFLLISIDLFASTHLIVEGKLVHPGCVYELVTKSNGDNIVSEVHLTKTSFRGCLSSNKYHQKVLVDGKGHYFLDKELFGKGSFYYEVIASVGKKYAMRTVEHGDGTYIQRSIILAQLKESVLTYFDKKSIKTQKKVTTLKLIGDIENVSKALDYLKML